MFSQTTEYALRAAAWLALSPDKLVATADLAKATKVPSNYLSKVLQQLSQANLIVGRRGVGGGYRLSRPADRITLLEIVRAVGTLDRIRECPLGLKEHGTNLCPLHRTVDQAAAAVIEILAESTLQDLITEPGANTPLCERATVAMLNISAKRS